MNQDKKFKRQCCYCRLIKSKDELIRITKDFKTKEVKVNINNNLQGRSVYICKNIECVEKAVKAKKLEASLKTKLPETVKEELSNLLQN